MILVETKLLVKSADTRNDELTRTLARTLAGRRARTRMDIHSTSETVQTNLIRASKIRDSSGETVPFMDKRHQNDLGVLQGSRSQGNWTEDIRRLYKAHHVSHDWDITDVKNIVPPHVAPAELIAKDVRTGKVDDPLRSLEGNKVSDKS